MGRIEFFFQGLKHINDIGTVTRSSKNLSKSIASHVNYADAKVIVEIGAGDGVITKQILKKMQPDAKLISFEINSVFCTNLRAIGDDRLVVIEDSAEKILDVLEQHGYEKADYIVSAVPFVAFSNELTLKIVNACRDGLKKNGKYIQLHYSLKLKDLYESVFGNVTKHFVLLNVPPAFVLVSEKE